MSHPIPTVEPDNMYPEDNMIQVKPINTKGKIAKSLKEIIYDGFKFNS